MKKLIRWVEIPAENMERAVDFYNSLLGLELRITEGGGEKMACFPNDEGAISQAPGFHPSVNGVLVSLDMGSRLEQAVGTVSSLGGKVVHPISKIEAEGRGSFALVIDSEGNKIGLYGKE